MINLINFLCIVIVIVIIYLVYNINLNENENFQQKQGCKTSWLRLQCCHNGEGGTTVYHHNTNGQVVVPSINNGQQYPGGGGPSPSGGGGDQHPSGGGGGPSPSGGGGDQPPSGEGGGPSPSGGGGGPSPSGGGGGPSPSGGGGGPSPSGGGGGPQNGVQKGGCCPGQPYHPHVPEKPSDPNWCRDQGFNKPEHFANYEAFSPTPIPSGDHHSTGLVTHVPSEEHHTSEEEHKKAPCPIGPNSHGGGGYPGPPIITGGTKSFAKAWNAACGSDEACKNQCPSAMCVASVESRFDPTIKQISGGNAWGGYQVDPRNGNYTRYKECGANMICQSNIVQQMTNKGQDWSAWATCKQQADPGETRCDWKNLKTYNAVCKSQGSPNPSDKIPNGCG